MAKRSTSSAAPSDNRPVNRRAFAAANRISFAIAAILLLFAIGFVYGPALKAPFIFDDINGIVENDSIRSLWPLIGPADHPGPLNPGPNMPTSPRPLVNLSLAVNYAFGGFNPFGYHLFSASIHFLTALALWALVERTFQLPCFHNRFNTSAPWLAFAAALLWALHPLATESVIYATQRSEQMMSLFYIFTLYCSLQYFLSESGHSRPRRSTQRDVWLALATAASLCGMASKEVMVSAPLMVLLYERTFIAGSFPAALRRSWPLYIALASTWILLVIVSVRAPYGTAAGLGAGVPVYHWWLTQTQVFLMYLKLAIWPHPLLIHYQLPYLTTLAAAWPYVVATLALLGITLWLLWRNQPLGFLAAVVFVVLAPTSLIPIRLEMAAERRMYLPLAALVTLCVIAGYAAAENIAATRKGRRFTWQAAALIALSLILMCGAASAARLRQYDNELGLWQQVLQYQPENLVAHNNIGKILTDAGRTDEAIAVLEDTIRIKPDYVFALNNLGNALSAAKRYPEAVARLEEAVRYDPTYFQARNNLAIALTRLGRYPQAIEQLQKARELAPTNLEVRCNLGNTLTSAGRLQDAIAEYEAVLAADPKSALALTNLNIALARLKAATQLNPTIPAYAELAKGYMLARQPQEAIATANQAIALAKQAGHPETVLQIQQFLNQYQAALKKSGGPQSPPPAGEPSSHERGPE